MFTMLNLNPLNCFVILTIITGLYLNVYKLAIMYDCYKTGKTYRIFPWDPQSKPSKSDPIWLMIHLILACLLLIVSGHKVIYQNLESIYFNRSIFNILHFAFTFMIFINSTHFVDLPVVTALMINLIPLIVMNYVYFSECMYHDEIYFMVLAFPVLLEGYKFMNR